MINLFIYAYPAQMITFQKVTSTGKIIDNNNCIFEDTVQTVAEYYQEKDINTTYIVGDTPFADKISNMIIKAFPNVTIERIRND